MTKRLDSYQSHFEEVIIVESKTVHFEKPGPANTEAVLHIVKQRAEELNIKTIVVASSYGETAVKAVDILKGLKVIAVTRIVGYTSPNTWDFTDENRKIVESKGGEILATTHAFGGLSRALSNKHETYLLGWVVMDTLRIFGEGMKVACEITLMATDGGLVRTDEDVIAVAGTGRGADMAIVLRPVNTRNFFDLKVKEILCKPRL
jgi:hypothetical protein